jgi:hypothetical protein
MSLQCPLEIAEIVHEILRIGILRIRAAAWNGDAARSAIEADHLHNLPALLADYRPELLDFYVTIERLGFSEHFSPEELAEFDPLWEVLAKFPRPLKKQAG